MSLENDWEDPWGQGSTFEDAIADALRKRRKDGQTSNTVRVASHYVESYHDMFGFHHKHMVLLT